jgi:hypothetical protein
VDYNYIDLLNKILLEIVEKINDLVVDEIKVENLKLF